MPRFGVNAPFFRVLLNVFFSVMKWLFFMLEMVDMVVELQLVAAIDSVVVNILN